MKYKIWHIERKEWIQDSWNVFIDPDGEVFEIEERNAVMMSYMHKQIITNEVKVLRYTGLKDHTNAEIYEGDIVFAYSNEYTYVIKFGEYPNDHDREYKCTGWYAELVGEGYKCSLQMTEGLEIIGNIYSAPHLLPKEDES